MAESTKIAWCDSTFNPWLGCTKVSDGCTNCYAEVQDSRMRWEGKKHWGAGVPRHRTSISTWSQPRAWNRKAGKLGQPWRVFCASLADVFDNEVPPEWRQDLFTLINETPHLDWLLCTKRIANVGRMVPSIDWLAMHDNVRILITVVNQEEADRDIPKLLALPCKNGVSYEPALGPVDWSRHLDYLVPTLNWIIVGGESGTKARPFDLEWARSTVAQCKAAGVPVFVKQLGSAPVFGPGPYSARIARAYPWDEPEKWPEDLRVREFPA